MTAKMKPPADFESALEKLEEITEKLESGELKLDEAIKLYTEGVDLVGYCHKELAAAEKRIAILKKKNEEFIESVFEPEEADDD